MPIDYQNNFWSTSPDKTRQKHATCTVADAQFHLNIRINNLLMRLVHSVPALSPPPSKKSYRREVRQVETTNYRVKMAGSQTPTFARFFLENRAWGDPIVWQVMRKSAGRFSLISKPGAPTSRRTGAQTTVQIMRVPFLLLRNTCGKFFRYSTDPPANIVQHKW